MYNKYKEIGGTRSFSTIYAHFKAFWPDLKKIPTYSDYCGTCFIKRKLMNSAHDAEEEYQIREDLQEHLEKARLARENYKTINIGKVKLHSPEELKCISIDWGQNWDLPRFSKQPGELYFLQKEKVGIFGVTDEGLDVQHFFCVCERELNCYGKGPNAVISYLDYYFKNISGYSEKLIVYADNCAAQNKNNYLLWYFHWLVHTCQLFKQVELNFLIAGHTKFSPDRHFGYAKSQLNRSESCETIFDVAEIVEKSSTNQKAIITRDLIGNKPNVVAHDWKQF